MIRLLPLTMFAVQAAAMQPFVVDRWELNAGFIHKGSVEGMNHRWPAKLEGATVFSAKPDALSFDGKTNAIVIDAKDGDLPTNEFSAEAWVAPRSGGAWGGVMGCIQDNGDFERGWVLGYKDSKWCFAVSTGKKLTYLAALDTMRLNHWAHVVGTYDGTTMRLFVNGLEVANSAAQNGPVAYAPAPFVIGTYRDKDENYPFSGLIAQATLWSRALPMEQIEAQFAASSKVMNPGQNLLLQPLVGPWVKFTSHDTATVYWESEDNQKGAVVFGETTAFGARASEAEASMNHSVELRGLKPKTKYFYQLRFPTADGADVGGETYSLETDFNFIRPPQPDVKPFAGEDEKAAKIAEWWEGHARSAVGEPRGYILDYGCGDGQLVWELAKAMPGVSVIGVSDDAAAIAKARAQLDAAGVYGNRVTLMHCDLKKLPFHPDTFDWVISSDVLRSGKVPGPVEEALRVTKPRSAFPMEPPWGSITRPEPSPYDELGLKHWRKWWSTFDDRVESNGEEGANDVLNILHGIRQWEGYLYWKIAPKGAGAWSHAYGDASNTANSGDSVVADGEVGLRWFGEPGARGMMDRQPRNAPPLCVNGTFYIQGNNRLFALDAYNGAVRWSVEVPNLRRVNVPRDSSNMCASTYGLFVAVKDRVWHFSDANGRLSHSLKVPAEDRDWGWLACHQDSARSYATVFGSTIKPGSTYTEFEGGEAFWYDTHTEASTAKVLSDSVFAFSQNGNWTDKSKGVVINSTLCLGGDRIYFVENPTFPFDTGRAEKPELYKGAQLVALDAKTGKRLWHKPLAIGGLGIAEALYLSYSDGKLVLLDSANKAYHTFAFSAKNGNELWHRTHPWKRDHHGGHLYHPVIVRGMVIVEPFGYDLATGDVKLSEMPERGGCSTLSAAKDALHFINWDYDKGSLYTWDLTSGSQRKFSGSRGNCFLSFISGSGMMLLPTASGGCSCRYPNQVTLGFGSK